MEKHLLNILTGKLKMANKDKNKEKDIPVSNKPFDTNAITYDQLGEFLGKTLSKLHEEDLKRFNNKNKKKKK
jgi:hypothetical protein